MGYDKYKVKETLEPEDMYDILEALGAEPEMKDNSIVCKTICHGGNSHKLYYYCEQKLFHCYTGCEPATFDIFELIQKTQHCDLNEAVYYVVTFFNLQSDLDETDTQTLQADMEVFRRYARTASIEIKDDKLVLPEIDDSILQHYPQPYISDWEQEHISKDVCDYMGIRYDPTEGAVLIPHQDENGRLVGIRQRTLVQEDEKWGKYRPWRHGNKQFNHPLGFNLYGLYQAKDRIKQMKTAIIVESEKSVLQAIGYLGMENNIVVAVCGSNISAYQFNLLRDLGVKTVYVGFDADYHSIGDSDWERVINRLQKIYLKYCGFVDVKFLFDTSGKLLGYKQSPTDAGKEVFNELLHSSVSL